MDDRDIRQYNDIIELQYQKSKTRAHMPLRERAAQFSPFAALVGFDGEIAEVARVTEAERELSEEERSILDARLRLIKEFLENAPVVQFTWFVADGRKAGGAYVTREGVVRKIDDFKRRIILTDGSEIPIDKISSIESELFCGIDT